MEPHSCSALFIWNDIAHIHYNHKTWPVFQSALRSLRMCSQSTRWGFMMQFIKSWRDWYSSLISLQKNYIWWQTNMMQDALSSDIFSLLFCRTHQPVIRHQVIRLKGFISFKLLLPFHGKTWWFSFAAESTLKDVVDYVRIPKTEVSSVQVGRIHNSVHSDMIRFNYNWLFC